MTGEKLITIVIPLRNEENYIQKILDFVINAKPILKEVYFVDGMSTDNTVAAIKNAMSSHSFIHLISNPKKFVPYALNEAISVSKGDPIIRLDAHTEYAEDYLVEILNTFEKTGADIVGGPMRARGITPIQKAVAYCTSTPFGIGDSQFHNEDAEGYVDSVYLGAWRRSVFNDVGMFDTMMIRNQDDEFHYRAKSLGKTIYLNPKIKSIYYPRDSFKKLYSQYFQYGLFKPLVLRKVKSGLRIRHLIPSLFVVYILLLIPAKIILGSIVFIPLCFYILLAFVFAFKSKLELPSKLAALLIYPILHISYGSGFLIRVLGLSDFFFKTK
jgi:glycosyltransferase involved in cell wall biosynthesis